MHVGLDDLSDSQVCPSRCHNYKHSTSPKFLKTNAPHTSWLPAGFLTNRVMMLPIHVHPTLSILSHIQLASALYVFGSARHRSPELMEAIHPLLISRAPRLSPFQLYTAAWAYERLSCYDRWVPW